MLHIYRSGEQWFLCSLEVKTTSETLFLMPSWECEQISEFIKSVRCEDVSVCQALHARLRLGAESCSELHLSCKMNSTHNFRKHSLLVWIYCFVNLTYFFYYKLVYELKASFCLFGLLNCEICKPCQLDSSQLITGSTLGARVSLTHSHMLSSALIFRLGHVMLTSHSIHSLSPYLHWPSFSLLPFFFFLAF